MAVRKTITAESPKTDECVYSKEQIIAAERFGGRKDLLNAVLCDSKRYTIKEVEKIIDEFMKGKVK